MHRLIEKPDELILRIAGELELCRRLAAISGVGPVIAAATIPAIANGQPSLRAEDLLLGWED